MSVGPSCFNRVFEKDKKTETIPYQAVTFGVLYTKINVVF